MIKKEKTNKKLTHEDFMNFFNKLEGHENIEVLSKYKDNKTKIKFKCKIHNLEFERAYGNIRNGVIKCPKCRYNNGRNNTNIKKTTEQFKKEVKDKYGDEYVVIGQYVNTNTKIQMLHNIDNCKEIFEVTPKRHLQGSGCPKCKGGISYTKEQYIEKLKETRPNIIDDYDIIKYDIKVGKLNGVELLHKKCNKKFSIPKTRFLLEDYVCPYCFYSSKGERKIMDILNELNITYETQYKFDDCFYKDKLPFDFYVYTEKFNFLIEFDGQQHFKQVSNWNLKDCKLRDSIKNDYCIKNKIKLLRISESEYKNLKEIILEFISSTTIETNEYIFMKGVEYKTND